jgi:pilus assembly protein Flp/PilA
MLKSIKYFLRDQSGATAIEYVLIASIISIAIILGATALGSKLNSTFNDISTNMSGPLPRAFSS